MSDPRPLKDFYPALVREKRVIRALTKAFGTAAPAILEKLAEPDGSGTPGPSEGF